MWIENVKFKDYILSRLKVMVTGLECIMLFETAAMRDEKTLWGRGIFILFELS